jgi:coenzyme F420-reducing hydrogenase beta subunit
MLHSADADRRHSASAGGVVTELARYMLEKNTAQTALGFAYQKTQHCYVPKWLYCAEEVVSVGSIYHEVPVVRFLRENLSGVRPPLVMLVLPCQVRVVRNICKKAGISVFVISLVCSGQLTLEATHELFRRVIKGKQVEQYRYRGGGWPSGVTIKCSDGEEIFLSNNHSIWTNIFHSGVYNLPRCFSCKDTFGIGADITVGDPWLPRYINNESEGLSMCIPQTSLAILTLDRMLDYQRLMLREKISSQEVLESQRGTLEKKAIYRLYPNWINKLRALYRHPLYRSLVFHRHIGTHLWFHWKCMNLLRRF